MNLCIPMRLHVKSRNQILRLRCINETYAIDNWFSTTIHYEGYNCAYIFYGTRSKVVSHYGLVTESDGPNALLDFSGRKVFHYQQQYKIQGCSLVMFGMTICGSSG